MDTFTSHHICVMVGTRLQWLKALGHMHISFLIAISVSKTINKAHNSCIWISLEPFKVETMATGAFYSFPWM